MRPHRQQPTRLPRPWDSPGKNTEVGCHFLLQCMKVKSESEVAQSQPHGLQPTRLLHPRDFPGKQSNSLNSCRICHPMMDHQGLKRSSLWLTGKESACNAGDPGPIPGSGRFPGEVIGYPFQYSWTSPVAQLVKNLPATRETWVQSLGQKDALKKEMAAHSNILAWKIPWTEEPGGLQSMGPQSQTKLSDFTSL